MFKYEKLLTFYFVRGKIGHREKFYKLPFEDLKVLRRRSLVFGYGL